MFRLFTKKALTALLLAASVTPVTAQVFQSPTAYEFTYGDPNMKFPRSTSCHAMPAGAAYFPSLGLGSTDLYVAAWNDTDPGAPSEVTVLLTVPGDPTSLLWQGSIPYTDVQDLEVGSLRNPTVNETNILVAYYQPGQGHFLDVYELGPGGSYSLIDHKVLSHSPTYGRIRMDFHALWTGAIAWINTEPGANKGIQTIVYDNNTWSSPTTINGTANKTDVDIALEQPGISASTQLHLVYAGGGFITETSFDVSTLATSPATITPIPNDNNYVGAIPISRLVIDCPGFSLSGSRWAYTYSDLFNVVVRYRDPMVAGGMPQTAVVTAGMLGNIAIAGQYKMYSPTLNYELHLPSTGQPQNDIMVAWYATDGVSFNSYIALKMDPTGTFLTSAGDYLLLPNAQTSVTPVPLFSGVALNKTDAKTPSPFSYATYFDVDPVSGLYQLHHAFHSWGDVAFRGQAPATEAPEQNLVTDIRIGTYPNPFSNQLKTTVTMPQSGSLELVLTDITGRVATQTKTTLSRGSHQISMDNLGQLAPGTYLLTILVDNKKAGIRKVTKQ